VRDITKVSAQHKGTATRRVRGFQRLVFRPQVQSGWTWWTVQSANNGIVVLVFRLWTCGLIETCGWLDIQNKGWIFTARHSCAGAQVCAGQPLSMWFGKNHLSFKVCTAMDSRCGTVRMRGREKSVIFLAVYSLSRERLHSRGLCMCKCQRQIKWAQNVMNVLMLL
jgi:hypothetical protein